MSDLETRYETSSGVGFLTPGADRSTIQWIESDAHARATSTRAEAARGQRSDNTTALIVIGLTFACTVLAIFDLFQLAGGF
jgi:hypothetical protein